MDHFEVAKREGPVRAGRPMSPGDPMAASDPFNGSAPGLMDAPEPAPAAWDMRRAINAARDAAGARRHVLFAELALRLAQLGHVAEVRFTVTDGTPFEAVRSALAASGGTETDPRLSAYGSAGDKQPDLGSAPLADAAHALAERSEALAKRTRACLVCGTVFDVNPRHAEKHRCCSAVCRSRYRRAEARRRRETVAMAS